MVHLACGLLSNHRTGHCQFIQYIIILERGGSYPLKPPPPLDPALIIALQQCTQALGLILP
jgi:hypothetical protein